MSGGNVGNVCWECLVGMAGMFGENSKKVCWKSTAGTFRENFWGYWEFQEFLGERSVETLGTFGWEYFDGNVG